MPREGCSSWKTWAPGSRVDRVGRSRRSSRRRWSRSTETALRNWIRQADIDAGNRSDGLTSDERAELARLRRDNRRLQQDVDILKRATAFFANETR